MKSIRIVMTGVTGLLGRNLLFEFIKQYQNNLDLLTIFILGRNSKGTSLQERIHDFFPNDGHPYLDLPDSENIRAFLLQGIHYVETDFNDKTLAISPENMTKLKSGTIDLFFHIGSMTDFRDSPNVKKLLWETNVKGTERVLNLVKSLNTAEFCYVSSAYCCGKTSGQIMPDYVNFDQEFRNPYEQSKLEAEVLSRKFARKTGIRYRCFRPSTICGRLIEEPLGMINKFDVFYGFAAFWLYTKLKLIPDIDQRYETPLQLDASLCYRMDSGLNIVPADYAAKVMYQVCIQNHPAENYHLVNRDETPHDLYIGTMLELLNINGTKTVSEIPAQLNPIESFFYKSAGKVLMPYVTEEPMLFDTSNLDDLLTNINLHCPPVNKENFLTLMNYAKQQDFGVDIGRFSKSRSKQRPNPLHQP